MRSISEIVKQFKRNWTEQLGNDSIEEVCRQCDQRWIRSLLNPVTTIQLLLLQVLHGNTACTALPHLSRLSFTAAAYCKARMRVKLEVLQRLLERCVKTATAQTHDAGLWLGRRVFFVDGSSFSMPDTPQLQQHFGQPGCQRPGCGFPVAHWLVMMHMSTGMITRMLTSPLRTHDMKRIARLHPELQQDDVLVADRGFCSYPHLCLLIQRGVDALLRVHQKTIVDFTPGRVHAVPGKGKSDRRKGLPRSKWLRQLGVCDQIVQWLKHSQNKPAWMSREQFAGLPDQITVRELRYPVHKKGFRVRQVTLVTTLLDDQMFSLPELAELFRRRWEIETNFAHMKTTMGMEVLKCQTVEGVLRELHAFALVYNLIREVMQQAADRQKVPVNRISFIDALRWLKSAREGDCLCDLVVLPDRKDRYEPRVKKRRSKNYRLMRKPRWQLKQNLTQQHVT